MYGLLCVLVSLNKQKHSYDPEVRSQVEFEGHSNHHCCLRGKRILTFFFSQKLSQDRFYPKNVNYSELFIYWPGSIVLLVTGSMDLHQHYIVDSTEVLTSHYSKVFDHPSHLLVKKGKNVTFIIWNVMFRYVGWLQLWSGNNRYKVLRNHYANKIYFFKNAILFQKTWKELSIIIYDLDDW